MLAILYQDEHLVAVHKPPGLLVHRTGLDAGETRFALQMRGCQRLWLQAQRLTLQHPQRGALLSIEAALEPLWEMWTAYESLSIA